MALGIWLSNRANICLRLKRIVEWRRLGGTNRFLRDYMQYLITTFDNGHIDWNGKTDLLTREASYIWSLYKKGILRSIWFSEQKDALFIIEVEDKETAHQLLDNLPLAKENLIQYRITSLLPYTGLERIMNGTDQ